MHSVTRLSRHFGVLFLLVDGGAWAGGTQVIVETAAGMRRLGLDVKIAIKESAHDEYKQFFPGCEPLFHYYRHDSEVVEYARHFDAVVATIFHSVRLLKIIADKHPRVLSAYFVQDYEPWFLEERHPQRKQAEQSYTLIPGCVLFALSPWAREVVAREHGVTVEKVWGGLDQERFHPDSSRAYANDGAVSIAAMIRPATPWRGAAMTMKVLSEVKQLYGAWVAVNVFGASAEEIEAHCLSNGFAYTNHGPLGRDGVAALLRASDVFVDFSEFQAFGRTALEAMACGCAVIAPEEGGVRDYGEHGRNLLLVDTSDKDACIAALCALLDDPRRRDEIARQAVVKAAEYSFHRAALSVAELLQRRFKSKRRE